MSAPSPAEPAFGYTFLRSIGSGTYGDVYLATLAPDASSGNSSWAVKEFRYAAEHDKLGLRLALRELRLLQSLDHPLVIRLERAFRSPSGRLYAVFPYISGGCGQDVLRSKYEFGLPPRMLKSFAWQLCVAVRYLHDCKVLHRDIKPPNILLASDGSIRLCDFGFARRPNDPRDGLCKGEGLTEYVVTRAYRAPEVLLGQPYGTPADVWALGCTLAEMATGRTLLPGSSSLDQLWRCLGALPAEPWPATLAAAVEALGRLDPAQLGGSLTQEQLRPMRLPGRPLAARLAHLDTQFVEVVTACLRLDPATRASADQLLRLPYFDDVRHVMAGNDTLVRLYDDVMYERCGCGTQPRAAGTASLARQHSLGATSFSAASSRSSSSSSGGSCEGVSGGAAAGVSGGAGGRASGSSISLGSPDCGSGLVSPVVPAGASPGVVLATASAAAAAAAAAYSVSPPLPSQPQPRRPDPAQAVPLLTPLQQQLQRQQQQQQQQQPQQHQRRAATATAVPQEQQPSAEPLACHLTHTHLPIAPQLRHQGTSSPPASPVAVAAVPAVSPAFHKTSEPGAPEAAAKAAVDSQGRGQGQGRGMRRVATYMDMTEAGAAAAAAAATAAAKQRNQLRQPQPREQQEPGAAAKAPYLRARAGGAVVTAGAVGASFTAAAAAAASAIAAARSSEDAAAISLVSTPTRLPPLDECAAFTAHHDAAGGCGSGGCGSGEEATLMHRSDASLALAGTGGCAGAYTAAFSSADGEQQSVGAKAAAAAARNSAALQALQPQLQLLPHTRYLMAAAGDEDPTCMGPVWPAKPAANPSPNSPPPHVPAPGLARACSHGFANSALAPSHSTSCIATACAGRDTAAATAAGNDASARTTPFAAAGATGPAIGPSAAASGVTARAMCLRRRPDLGVFGDNSDDDEEDEVLTPRGTAAGARAQRAHVPDPDPELCCLPEADLGPFGAPSRSSGSGQVPSSQGAAAAPPPPSLPPRFGARHHGSMPLLLPQRRGTLLGFVPEPPSGDAASAAAVLTRTMSTAEHSGGGGSRPGRSNAVLATLPVDAGSALPVNSDGTVGPGTGLLHLRASQLQQGSPTMSLYAQQQLQLQPSASRQMPAAAAFPAAPGQLPAPAAGALSPPAHPASAATTGRLHHRLSLSQASTGAAGSTAAAALGSCPAVSSGASGAAIVRTATVSRAGSSSGRAAAAAQAGMPRLTSRGTFGSQPLTIAGASSAALDSSACGSYTPGYGLGTGLDGEYGGYSGAGSAVTTAMTMTTTAAAVVAAAAAAAAGFYCTGGLGPSASGSGGGGAGSYAHFWSGGSTAGASAAAAGGYGGSGGVGPSMAPFALSGASASGGSSFNRSSATHAQQCRLQRSMSVLEGPPGSASAKAPASFATEASAPCFPATATAAAIITSSAASDAAATGAATAAATAAGSAMSRGSSTAATVTLIPGEPAASSSSLVPCSAVGKAPACDANKRLEHSRVGDKESGSSTSTSGNAASRGGMLATIFRPLFACVARQG